MKSEFVSFEQAKALKGLGFDEPCLAIFEGNSGRLFYPLTHHIEEEKTRNSDIWEWDIAAPTWNQAFKFFRERGVSVEIVSCTDKYNKEDGRYQYGIGQKYYDPYDSYEVAQTAALDHLIQQTGYKFNGSVTKSL